MSINRGIFASYMAVLGERIGKEISGPTQNVYRAAFDRHDMTDAEFISAAQGIFEHWTGFGLPSVDEFLRYARPVALPRSDAIEALRAVAAAVGKREAANLEDKRVLAAWRAVGGASVILNASESEWPHLERRWVAAFTDTGDLETRTAEAEERIARAQRQLGELNGSRKALNPIGEILPLALPAGVRQ